MFRAPPTSNLLTQEGRPWWILCISYSTLTLAWLSWPSVQLRWLRRVMYHLEYHGWVLLVFRLAECRPRPQCWSLLKYLRNFSNHRPVFRPIRLPGLCRYPMNHVVMTPVLIWSRHISNWSLCMLVPPLMTEVVTPLGKRCSYGHPLQQRFVLEFSYLWIRGWTTWGYVLLCDSFGNGWNIWM